VQEAFDLYAPLGQERGLTVEIAAGHEDALCECDRGRVLQVLGNLLGNALKFTPEGGHVTLRTSRGPGAVMFEVSDTGPGIAPRDLPHVFERYWKSDPKGTGLGLYIARSIVQAHGGSLGVRSEVGRGSTFFFTLPARV